MSKAKSQEKRPIKMFNSERKNKTIVFRLSAEKENLRGRGV